MSQNINFLPIETIDFTSFERLFSGLWAEKNVTIHKVKLAPGTYILGRGTDTAASKFKSIKFTFLKIENEEISRAHLKIEVTPIGSVFITDLGSKNETRLNNQLIQPRERVGAAIDDVIKLSHTTKLTITFENKALQLWIGTI